MTATPPANLPQTLKRARKAAGFANAKAFLEAVRIENGSAPSYSSYAQWESGEVGPRDESLRPIVAFHEKRGTWAPEQQAPDVAAALVMLAQELRALREERHELVARVEELEATMRVLVPATDVVAGSEAAARLHVPRG